MTPKPFINKNKSNRHGFQGMVTCSTLMAVLMIVAIFFSGCKKREAQLFIKNVNIVAVETGAINRSQDIVIQDDVIVAISENTSPMAGDQVIDGTGKYVIPGLWDMHVHFEGWGYEPMVSLMVANGVLGARDMGGNSLERLDSLRAELGASLPPMQVLRPGKMIDGPTPGWPFRITVTDSTEAVKAVSDNLELGVDFIKVHQQLSKESFMAIAGACKEQGVLFAGHVPNTISGIEAAEAGIASIEHLTGGTWCEDKNCTDFDEALQVYKANNTYHTPTLMIYHSGKRRYEEGLIAENMKPYLNTWAKKEWAKQDSINEQFLPPVDQRLELNNRMAQNAFWMAGKLFENQIPVMTGTDAGFVGVIPGFDLHEELRLFVEEAGATPLQALQSATLNPAKLYKQEKSGTVAVGNYANILLLNENPMEQIKATRDIYGVITHGKWYDQNALKALKSKAASFE